MKNLISLNSNKYMVVIIHVNDVVEKIINVPHYDAAQQWVSKVRKCSPKMIVVLDEDGNDETHISRESAEDRGGFMFGGGKAFMRCDESGRTWWTS